MSTIAIKSGVTHLDKRHLGRPIRIRPNPGLKPTFLASKKARPNPSRKHLESSPFRSPVTSEIASKEQRASDSLPPPNSPSPLSELPWGLERVHFMHNRKNKLPHGFIGSGGFGSVSLVRHKHQGTLAALKVVRLAKGQSNVLVREIAALQRIRAWPNRFVLRQPLGINEVMWTSDSGHLYLIFDLYVGNLSHYCGQLQVKNERFLGLVITELYTGLAYLHDMGFIHKDIKPDNILIDRDGHCVIADLGGCDLSPGITPDSRMVRRSAGVVTFTYSAPELNKVDKTGRVTYTQAVDLWSLGATLCSLITPSLPRIVESPPGGAMPKYSIKALGLDHDSIRETLGEHGCPLSVTELITELCCSDFRERLDLDGLDRLIHDFGWSMPLGYYTPFPVDRSKPEVVLAGKPRSLYDHEVGAGGDAAEALLEFDEALGKRGFAVPRLGRLPGLGPL